MGLDTISTCARKISSIISGAITEATIAALKALGVVEQEEGVGLIAARPNVG